MTLKEYALFWKERHADTRGKNRYRPLLSILQEVEKTEQFQQLETGEELSLFMWWYVKVSDQELVKMLVRSYRRYCQRNGLKAESITLIR